MHKKGIKAVFALVFLCVALASGYAWACSHEKQGDFTEREVNLRLAATQKKQIVDAINQVASGEEAKWLLAIALHESGGTDDMRATHSSSGASCAFQIMPNGHIDAAIALNMDPVPSFRHPTDPRIKIADRNSRQYKAVHEAILSDPVACVKAGRKILGYFLPAGATDAQFDRAMCRYGGQCLDPPDDKCNGSKEIRAILAVLNGDSVEHRYVDKTKPEFENDPTVKHGDVQLYVNGRLIGVLRACMEEDADSDMSLEIAKASRAYRALVSTTIQDQWDNSYVRDRESMKSMDPTKKTTGLRGTIARNHCLGKILDPNGFFKRLREMFDEADNSDPRNGILARLARQVVTGIMSEIAQRTCQFVAEALNTFMRSLCIPLPSFSFGLNLNLPQLSGGYCDGLSMADVIKFTSRTTPGMGGFGEYRISVPSRSDPSWVHIPIRGYGRTNRINN